jgi:CheY-like chemotaxis protein
LARQAISLVEARAVALGGLRRAGSLEPEANREMARERAAENVAQASVLVVEDEASLRRLICISLEKRNYRVLAAKDGEEALEIFRRRGTQIQLIVSDLVMPQMDGLELKAQILALRSDVKFLFMSGYAEHVVEKHDESLKGCAFLEKPFLPEELILKVSGMLAGEAAA